MSLNNPYKYVDEEGNLAVEFSGNVLGGVNTLSQFTLLAALAGIPVHGGTSGDAGFVYAGSDLSNIQEGQYASLKQGGFIGGYVGTGGAITFNLKADTLEQFEKQDLEYYGLSLGFGGAPGVSVGYSKEALENNRFWDVSSFGVSYGPGIGLGGYHFDSSLTSVTPVDSSSYTQGYQSSLFSTGTGSFGTTGGQSCCADYGDSSGGDDGSWLDDVWDWLF